MKHYIHVKPNGEIITLTQEQFLEVFKDLKNKEQFLKENNERNRNTL